MLAHLRLVHYSLEELVLSVSAATCDTRLSEVHNLKDILSILTCIAHSEVKPLLMASCVCIHLHVEAVLARCDAVRSQQVATLKDCVHK